MITSDLHMQTMCCSVCAEVHEIPRRVLRDPEQVLNMQESVERDHRECEQYSDVRVAISARGFRKRIERELAKAAVRRHPGVGGSLSLGRTAA